MVSETLSKRCLRCFHTCLWWKCGHITISRIRSLKINLALCNLGHKIILFSCRFRRRDIIAFEYRTEVRKKLPVFLCHRCDPAVLRTMSFNFFGSSIRSRSMLVAPFNVFYQQLCGIFPNDQSERVIGTSTACPEFTNMVSHQFTRFCLKH